MCRFYILLILIAFAIPGNLRSQNIDSLMQRYPIKPKLGTDTLLFDSRINKGLLLSYDLLSRNLNYGYTPTILKTKTGSSNAPVSVPYLEALNALSARYTFKSGIYFQAGANSLSKDKVFIALYDLYAGYNYVLIKEKLTGYLQVGYYINNLNTLNLRSALLYGYEGNVEYRNPIINTAFTYSGDYAQAASIRDLYGSLSLSHDFFLLYDCDDGAFAISPGNDYYVGSIRSTNIMQGKTVKQLIKKYGRRNYKKHLGELNAVTNYDSGFRYLYDMAQISFMYERKRWAATAVAAIDFPNKVAPLPQTIATNRLLIFLNFSYIFN